MRISKNITSLCLIVLLFVTYGAVAQKFQYLEYNTSSGLPDDYIYGVKQDSMGSMWIASGAGLVKLTDRESKLIKNDDPRSELIYDLELANRSIWLSGKNGFIAKSDGVTIDTLESPFKSKVLKVEKFRDSKIIFSSAKEGFYVYDFITEKGKLYSYDDFNTSKVRNVIIEDDNLFYCSNGGVTVIKYDEKNDQFNLVQNFKGVKYVNSILKDGEQLYLATEKKGVYNAVFVNGEIQSSTSGAEIGKSFGVSVRDISLDLDNKIWISTFGDGAFQLTINNNVVKDVKKYNVNNGLVSNFINGIFQDYEGNYWFETYGGGLAYRPNDYLKKLNLSLTGDKTIPAIEQGDNKLYLANKNKVYTYFLDSLYFVCELDDISYTISSISVLDSVHVFIGTAENGVFKYDLVSKELSEVKYKSETLAMKVNDLELDGDHLWIATYDGLYDYNWRNEEVEVYNSSNGLRHNLIRVIRKLKKQKRGIAVGTKNNRLFFIKDKKVSEIKLPSPNPNINISDIVEVNEKLLVGTLGGGLFLIERDSVKHFSQDDGLASNYIYGLKLVQGTKVLVVHQDNLTSIDIRTGNIDQLLEKIGFHHVFQMNAITKTENDEIQIGTDYGVIEFSPQDYYLKSIEPKVGFNQFLINDSVYDLSSQDLLLEYDKYKIELDYKGVNFNKSNKVHYEYFLEGFDEEWHDGDGYDLAIYKNIGPGLYKFKIRACVKGECLEKESLYSIKVDSPIWQKAWFVILVSVLLVLFVFGSFWLQDRENTRRKKVLEFNIKLKTQELNLKNDQILSSISYAKRIQDAVIPKIKFSKFEDKDELKYFTLEKPKDIVGGDFVWFAEDNDTKVLAVCDCTGHGVPGGFMTILAVNMLNEIISKGVFEPKDILIELDKAVKQKLYEDSNRTINDGLDMGIVSINKVTGKVKYAGANRPIVVDFKKEGFMLLKGTRRSIGDQYSKKDFKNIELNYKDIKMIYIYSDGVIDQFGGPNNKKFTTKRLLNLLSEINDEGLGKQKELLDTTLTEWGKTADSQTDDISFMGIRLNSSENNSEVKSNNYL